MNDTPSITTTDLRKEFGPVTATADVDLSVSGAQIIGVAGPSGAGKSVLLKILLGLIRPTNGSSLLFGVKSEDLGPTERRRIGYMPQHTALYDELTVQQNVRFFAELYSVETPDEQIREILEFVNLWDRRDARIDELSGGMTRRTSLASAIVHDPDLMILDEPTVGLDPKLRATMWDSFRERCDAGALILVSTHYLGEAYRCDRVLFLRNGRVLAMDTPDRFLERTGTRNLEDAFLDLLEDPAAETDTEVSDGEDQ
ncbi:ABC transporter ATP-binding protein [Haloferax sp. ATB1]|uniref:ABC transporter ATP-binding protein n=1 Tax=Haloferax sp. ATB1 TaxID=1508454 RepID=UPI00069409FB|nr:ABC transporter ATP-binding protein [Haloferax sp. ATB1]